MLLLFLEDIYCNKESMISLNVFYYKEKDFQKYNFQQDKDADKDQKKI